MDPVAISGIKKTAQACDFVRRELLEWIQPGMTTIEVDMHATHLIRETECISAVHGRQGFKGQICICLNNQIAHYAGQEIIIAQDDIIKLDISLRHQSWVADCGASTYFGQSTIIRELIEANKKAVRETAINLCPGLPEYDIAEVINCQRGDFHYIGELTGHGVGRSLHEEPRLPALNQKKGNDKIKAGQILAIEAVFAIKECTPVFPDKLKITTTELNAHHEETVLITANGSKILTSK
jgi:methionyl aminopeptidase